LWAGLIKILNNIIGVAKFESCCDAELFGVSAGSKLFATPESDRK